MDSCLLLQWTVSRSLGSARSSSLRTKILLHCQTHIDELSTVKVLSRLSCNLSQVHSQIRELGCSMHFVFSYDLQFLLASCVDLSIVATVSLNYVYGVFVSPGVTPQIYSGPERQ